MILRLVSVECIICFSLMRGEILKNTALENETIAEGNYILLIKLLNKLTSRLGFLLNHYV